MDREPTELSRFGLPLAWLAHPVTVIAVVLLAVNDHLLKAAYPGLLTGKLSDAVGLIAAPPMLALALIPILPHRSPNLLAGTAVLAIGVGFSAVKLSQTGAAAASVAWSTLVGPSVILADTTDLATLPALALAWWVWTRARQRPVTRVVARRFGTLIVLPAATLAMVATPAPRYPDAVAVTSWRGMVVIGEGDAFHEGRKPISFRVSHDGQVWRSMTETERTEFDPVADTLPFNELRDCVPDQPSRCYRAVPGHLRVEETSDGGATSLTSWQVSDDRRDYLARHYAEVGDVNEYLASRALLVHPVPGGHVVIVANGRDGYALRDASGQWERIGFGADGSEIGWGPTEDPPPLTGGLWIIAGELAAAFLIGLFALGIGAWRAAGSTRAAVTGFGVTLLVGVPIAFMGAVGLNFAGDSVVPFAPAAFLLGSVTMVVGAVGGVVCAAAMTLGRGWLALVLVAAAATASVFAALFIGWSAGLYSYRTAALAAVAIAVLGVVLSVRFGSRAERAPAKLADPPYPPPFTADST